MNSRPKKIYLLTAGEHEEWTVDSFVYTRDKEKKHEETFLGDLE